METSKTNKYSKSLLFLIFSTFFVSVRAESSSGAVVWWVMFSIIAITSASGYLIYLQYFQKQLLGKHHPDLEEVIDEEAGRVKTRNEKRREEEVKERYLAKVKIIHFKGCLQFHKFNNNIQQSANKPPQNAKFDRDVARPEHVS